MKTARHRTLILLGFRSAILLVTVFCSGQDAADGIAPLGDLARQMQAERARRISVPTRVYTNDDFSPFASPVTGTGESTPESTHKQSANQKVPAALTKNHATRDNGEEYFRATMRQLRSKLADDQKTLKDTLKTIRDRWDPTGFYTGLETPADRLSYHVPFHGDEFFQYQKLNTTKESIAADEKAISDLEDQCRRTACSPEWLR